MRFMLAFVVLVEGALLYGCAAAPAIVLPVESLDPPNNCILDIRDKDSQLKEVLCQLEKLADSLQDPAIPNAVSLELESCVIPEGKFKVYTADSEPPSNPHYLMDDTHTNSQLEESQYDWVIMDHLQTLKAYTTYFTQGWASSGDNTAYTKILEIVEELDSLIIPILDSMKLNYTCPLENKTITALTPEPNELPCQFYYFNISITSLKYTLMSYETSGTNVFSPGLTCCNVNPIIMTENEFQKLTCSSAQLAAESYNLMQELKSSNDSWTTNCSRSYSVWSKLATWEEKYSHFSSLESNASVYALYLASLKSHSGLLETLVQNYSSCLGSSVLEQLIAVQGIMDSSTLPLGSKWVNSLQPANLCGSQISANLVLFPLSLEASIETSCEENEITEKLSCQAVDIRFMAESLYVFLSVHGDASSTSYDCPLYDN